MGGFYFISMFNNNQKKSFSNLFIHDLIVYLDTERDRGINPGRGICFWGLGSHGHKTVN